MVNECIWEYICFEKEVILKGLTECKQKGIDYMRCLTDVMGWDATFAKAIIDILAKKQELP